MSSVLHAQSQVLSLRHSSSWSLLALSAGAVNAGAFLACGRFVTHVTGTVTSIGLDAAMLELMFDYALVLASFLVGAMLSVTAIQARTMRGLRPLHALPLFAVSAILLAVSAGGHVGLFGEMGGPVEQAGDFALLCVLAFAMGLMNASVATATGNLVRTTHMTGPATDLGVTLMMAWHSRGKERAEALRLSGLRAQKIASFCFGAAIMVPLVSRLDFVAFTLPAALVLAATLRSFLVPQPSSGRRDRASMPMPAQ